MKCCQVCGWRQVRGKGPRCNADRLFFLRNGRDRTVDEVGHRYEQFMVRIERALETAKTS